MTSHIIVTLALIFASNGIADVTRVNDSGEAVQMGTALIGHDGTATAPPCEPLNNFAGEDKTRRCYRDVSWWISRSREGLIKTFGFSTVTSSGMTDGGVITGSPILSVVMQERGVGASRFR